MDDKPLRSTSFVLQAADINVKLMHTVHIDVLIRWLISMFTVCTSLRVNRRSNAPSVPIRRYRYVSTSARLWLEPRPVYQGLGHMLCKLD